MPEPMTHVVTPDGVRLSARVFDPPDANAPGLLLLHGLASSQRIWDLMLPRLVRRFRVVTFDARGHGLSGKPTSGYGFDRVSADALAVVRHTRLRRPILAGHSWGAMTALELAARRPRAISGAVLVDGGVVRMRDSVDWPTAKEELAPPHLAGMPLEEFVGLVRTFFADSVALTPDVESIVLSLMRVRPDGTIAPRLSRANHFRILRAIWEHDPYAAWARIAVPTHAIVAHGAGGADTADWEAGKRSGVRVVRGITRDRPATLSWMRGIHDLPLQHPDALVRRIETFARRVVG
jgi:pimeloyl-ACP methyl ester carboxylesterase